jgi:hypothetical protein
LILAEIRPVCSRGIHPRYGILQKVRAQFGNEPMVGNEDLQLVAEGLMAAHGQAAARECEAVIAKMIERDDKTGAENWMRILAVVRELQASA